MERRGAISGDYLHGCRDLHARVTRIRYGRMQNLAAIEEAAAGIRSSRRLTYDDIEGIRDGRIWNADAFGYWPPRNEIESILESQEWDFWNLPRVVIPSASRICRQWGAIRCERRARTIAVDDAWIAATARAHGSPLVTHNPRDFQDIEGLRVLAE